MKQLCWIHNVYEELGFKLSPLPLCVDNQGAMFLASNPAQEGQTKHIRIPEHYIREAVELGEIKLYYVPMDLQFSRCLSLIYGVRMTPYDTIIRIHHISQHQQIQSLVDSAVHSVTVVTALPEGHPLCSRGTVMSQAYTLYS